VVNGDITSYEKAVAALTMSGADAVMVGRGAQGQPWLPGQIGRRIETGVAEPAPTLADQLKYVCSSMTKSSAIMVCASVFAMRARSRLGAGRAAKYSCARRLFSRPGGKRF